MIPAQAVRGWVRDTLTPIVPTYTAAPTGVGAFPAALIGRPSWDYDQGPCWDRMTLVVAVLVERTGTNDGALVEVLDGLHESCVGALRAALRADQTMGGLVIDGTVTRTTPDIMTVAGTDYPCLLVTLEITGG